MEPGSPVRVAVLSPYALVRAGLTGLARSAGRRVRVVLRRAGADVVLYDLAALAAEETRSDLQALVREVPVVGVAVGGCPDLTAGAWALGVRAVVDQDVAADDLVATLQHAAGGPRRTGPDRGALSDRERRVVTLIGAGLPNDEIAARLGIGLNSLKTYIRLAYRKIGVSSRSQAVLWASRHGLVPDPEQPGAVSPAEARPT